MNATTMPEATETTTTTTDEEGAELGVRSSDFTGTYSPDDNKLRLYAVHRLDRELYDRVRKAGFIWAPRQKLFVAPMWTPEREDLLLEIAGEIDDEDTSLVDRAEERADRFETYSDKRHDDATRAHEAVARIADNIPLGQPILVGHHSEKRARKDAEKIQNGMRRAVKLWETSRYWERRAKGAIRSAKYKELPAVRHRRIKGLEADRRKHAKSIERSEHYLRYWQKPDLARDLALKVAGYDRDLPFGTWSSLDRGEITVEQAVAIAVECHGRTIARAQRWITHLDHRLGYERAMLEESGGLAADRFNIEVGGQVLCGRSNAFLVVVRVQRTDGRVSSVRTAGRYTVQVEEITDYRPPNPGDTEKVKAATKLPPIVNYPGEGFVEMNKAEWDRSVRAQVGAMRRAKPTETHDAYRYRSIYRGGETRSVYVTDAKRAERPVRSTEPAPTLPARELAEPRPRPVREEAPASPFEAMKDSLRKGVQVVSAPQLFPTSRELAARMVDLAAIEPSHSVLEPSSGTGVIVDAIRAKGGRSPLTVEINARLAYETAAICADFLTLECGKDLGPFDRIVMNPPFGDGQDVRHIEHAFSMLKPGGRLVALCANGPKQQKRLRDGLVADAGGTWEALPEGTFAAQGTSVRVALLVVDRKA